MGSSHVNAPEAPKYTIAPTDTVPLRVAGLIIPCNNIPSTSGSSSIEYANNPLAAAEAAVSLFASPHAPLDAK